MTLEELSVVFSADIQPFTQAVEGVQGLVSQASASVDGLAGSFFQAGVQAANGLQAGLLAGRGSVASAAAQLAQAAAAALRNSLQIHSPSRVTQEMGQMFDAGFLQGILDKAPHLEAETGRLGLRTAMALEEAASPSSGRTDGIQAAPMTPVHVTLPLEIDGYRLGMAVIENLNRITQSTGRVELKL